jgi:hypothetical protein
VTLAATTAAASLVMELGAAQGAGNTALNSSRVSSQST